MKRKSIIMAFISILGMCITLVGCNTQETNTQECMYCMEEISEDANFCLYCGEKIGLSKTPDSEAILGTWEAYDEPWGRFTYTFYEDGSCIGTYHGNVGGVEPSLYIESYYEGCGDGQWEFVKGELIPLLNVSYNGDRRGDGRNTMQYKYEFNDDCTELTIYGVGTYGEREHGSLVWQKIE